MGGAHFDVPPNDWGIMIANARARLTALLIGTILILGGLQYLPALALGPIAEHFAMRSGKLF